MNRYVSSGRSARIDGVPIWQFRFSCWVFDNTWLSLTPIYMAHEAAGLGFMLVASEC